MTLKLRLSSLVSPFIKLFRRLMSPAATAVRNLFVYGTDAGLLLEPETFQIGLPPEAERSKLVSIEHYKNKSKAGKQHELLVLRFTHPEHPTARAILITHRQAKTESLGATSTLSWQMSSATAGTVPAADKVVVLHQGFKLKKIVTRKHKKLCALQYDPRSPAAQPPSALQMATLILTVSQYRPAYHASKNNCYWYSDTVYKATQRLFPGGEETKYPKYNDRAHFLLIPISAEPDTLPDILRAYPIA